jgi:hypothetical protein
MGNQFAFATLVIWPLLAIYFYKTISVQLATLLVIIGGFMFLPVSTVVDLPFLPSLGKGSIPVISALIGCWFIAKRRIHFFQGLGNYRYLILLFFAVPFFTAALNTQSSFVGGRVLPGLSFYDGFSSSLNQFFVIIPFLIGRQLFKTYNDQLLMFKFLVLAGLYYSALMLLEVRLSPQLHNWIYGYFPHSFAQTVRFGGFRPVVFMGHGLLVAFFAMVTFVSALTLWQSKEKFSRFPPLAVSVYLLVVLLLCKSLAALVYAVTAALAIKVTKVKSQYRIAVTFVMLAMFYPAMSIMDIFPHQTVLNVASSISESRAGSLEFRFDNEEILVEHGRDRFFFGWGGWGRNRVYNEETGKDETVTDGKWIITFGTFGILGFIAEFGLLAFAVLRARTASKLLTSKKEQILLSGHSLIIALVMIDQLPNASLSPWLWLLAGILLGRSEAVITQHSFKATIS